MSGASADRMERLLHRGRQVGLAYPGAIDRDEYVRVRRESRGFHEPWEPIPPAGFHAYGDDEFDRELATCRTAERECLLVVRLVDGALVGRIAFNQIIRGALQQCFLGYWIGAAYAGQGLMREGIGLALVHAFEGLGLHRVEANIQPSNGPSIGVVLANGFVREGFSVRYLQIAGNWADHERWAIWKERWESLRYGSGNPQIAPNG